MQHLKNLMLSRPYEERVPGQGLIAGDAGKGGAHVRATRGNGYAFYYLPHGGNVESQLGKVSGKKIKPWWYNPRDGKATEIGKYRNRGTKQFTAPGEAGRRNDWVLVLDDASQAFKISDIVYE